MTDNAGANHVGDEFVFLAIPRKENGAGTAAAVEFANRNDFHGGKINFILRNARGPKKADGVGNFLRAETNEQRSAVLAEITGGRRKFKFLIEGSGEEFNLGANAALVVVEAFEVDGDPIIFVCADVLKEKRSSAVLGDNQVRAAIGFQIGESQGARLRESQSVELNFFGDIGPAGVAEIAQQANFTAAAGGFADGHQIEPAVVIVVNPSEAPTFFPAEVGKGNAFEPFSLDIAPERNARSTGVGESDIHEAVFIKIENGDADCWRELFFCEVDGR